MGVSEVLRLTPSGSEGVGKSRKVVHPALRNFTVNGIHAQSKVAYEHCSVTEGLVEGVRIVNCAIQSLKLNGAGRALDQGPCVVEQAV